MNEREINGIKYRTIPETQEMRDDRAVRIQETIMVNGKPILTFGQMQSEIKVHDNSATLTISQKVYKHDR